MVLYSLTKFGIIKPWIIIQGFIILETQKRIYTWFEIKIKIFDKYQRFPLFPRKIVLYSLNKLFSSLVSIFNCSKDSIYTLKRLLKRFIEKSSMGIKERFFRKFQGLSRFSRKVVLYLLTKFNTFKSCTNIQ